MFFIFVATALREALGVSPRSLRSDTEIPAVHLDEASRVRLMPDRSWWESGTCTFLGDAKYKRIVHERVPNVDRSAK